MVVSCRFRSLLFVVLLVVAFGCERGEEPPAAQPAAAPSRKEPLRVVVPAAVQGQWQAVKVALADKESGREDSYTVEIGSELAVADSGLVLEVMNFLPAFVMDGSTMTSASNETTNPAAQVVISEGGERLFRGWLFSRYPGTHSFQHPRYSFALIDFVPAGEKKD